MLNSLTLKLYATASCPRKGVDLLTHLISLPIQREPKNLAHQAGRRLRGVKNDLCIGTRPDPLFSTGAYTARDKRPVEKIARRLATRDYQ